MTLVWLHPFGGIGLATSQGIVAELCAKVLEVSIFFEVWTLSAILNRDGEMKHDFVVTSLDF